MTHTTASPPAPSLRPLAMGLLAGPVIWSLYHLAVYLLAEAVCKTGILGGQVAGLPVVSAITLGLTLVGVAAVAMAGLASHRRYQRRHAQIQEDESRDRAETAARFLSLTAVLLSALFGLLILLTGIPALFLSPCIGQ